MSKPLVIVDPGHGGSDPGAVGFGKCERDWTLDVAKYVASRLNELGIKTVLTRTTDKTLDSVARTNTVKQSGAKYCLSLHYNAGGGEGVETIHSIYASDKIARAIAEEIHKEGMPFRRVFSKRGKNGDYYYMHRMTGSVETVIIEFGFIDNKKDFERMNTQEKRFNLAEAAVRGFVRAIGKTYKSPVGKKYKVDPAPTKKDKKETTTKPKKTRPSGRWADIQSTLNKRYGLNIAVDNIPGPETRRAIVKGVQTELNVQFKKGLVVDGKPGPKTRAAFVNVYPGSRGNLTWLLQVALLFNGFDPGDLDGINGPKTQKALKAFQKAKGLVVDGVAGKQTWSKLLE